MAGDFPTGKNYLPFKTTTDTKIADLCNLKMYIRDACLKASTFKKLLKTKILLTLPLYKAQINTFAREKK